MITPTGQVRAIYGEVLDLAEIGPLQIKRASHVELDEQGRWWADLGPADGPVLGPFALRSAALEAEFAWLELNWLAEPQSPPEDPEPPDSANGPQEG